MRRIALLVALLLPLAVAPSAAASKYPGGCNTRACLERTCDTKCEQRVHRKATIKKWRRVVAPYRALLRANMRCESGGDGGYRLYTTGNGFYYAHQFEMRAWVQTGGRPHRGLWSRQPTALEQDYRAVIWDRMHGGDPWPQCPFG